MCAFHDHLSDEFDLTIVTKNHWSLVIFVCGFFFLVNIIYLNWWTNINIVVVVGHVTRKESHTRKLTKLLGTAEWFTWKWTTDCWRTSIGQRWSQPRKRPWCHWYSPCKRSDPVDCRLSCLQEARLRFASWRHRTAPCSFSSTKHKINYGLNDGDCVMDTHHAHHFQHTMRVALESFVVGEFALHNSVN